MHRRISVIALVAAVALLTLVGTASASTLKGKVVHRNKSACSFALAKRGGQLVAVHAGRSPALGRTVTVTGRTLRNGTFGASRVSVGRLSHRAHIRGVVTFVNRSRTRFVVSARGVSLVVRKHALKRLPAVGNVVTVNGTFDQGDIDADNVENDGNNNDCADLEGQILSVDTTARTVTLTADDNDELDSAGIVVHIPDGWDMSLYNPGDVLCINATLNPDGSYTAVASSEDGNGDEADNGDGEENDSVDLEGQVLSVDTTNPADPTLTMTTMDDDEVDGAAVTVHIPVSWDLSDYQVNATIELSATPNADGTYTALESCDEED